MNILILSWRSPGHPNEGGAEQVTLSHAKAWVKAGHQVVWFSSEYKGGKIQEIIGGVIVIRKGGYVVGVRVHSVLWYFFGKHPKFDLVIDEFHGLPFFTPVFVRARKMAFIHEVAKEVWKLNPWPKPVNLLPSFFGNILEPYIFKLLYKKVPFMTVSESTKEDLIKWQIPRRGIMVVQNGVTVHLRKGPIVKNNIKTAMFLGALSRDKGVFDAIDVFERLDRKDDGWQFWVVGKGTKEYVNELISYAKTKGILEKVKFLGFVDEKKKFQMLSEAHVLVNPSVREGWGLVNIEAAACETPVFGYKVPGMKDSVSDGKTGRLFDFGDTSQMAEDIIKLLRDQSKYLAYRKACVAWAKKFTWEKSNKESLEIIESL